MMKRRKILLDDEKRITCLMTELDILFRTTVETRHVSSYPTIKNHF